VTKTKKYILGLVILCVIIAVSFAVREYNRKPSTLVNSPAAYRVLAGNLVSEYQVNEALADKKYLGKVIEVEGLLAAINSEADTLVTFFLGDTNSMKKVSCLLDRTIPINSKKYRPGEVLTIKGICTGVLMDVELNRCIIVTPQTK
jgi:hypothetical protein